MGPTEALVKYICESRFEDVPGDVIEKAKWIVLDTLGCALAGSQTELGRVVIDQVNELGGKKESLIFGKKMRTNSLCAGYCNTILSDALDFEETAPLAHPSAVIIPAALASGEMAKAPGKTLLLAVIAGYEVSLRIGYAILPSPEVQQMVAVAFSFLSFGACTASGKILNLTFEQMLNAFGYAGAATSLPTWATKWKRPLHWVKNNYGEQTQAGMLGALLSRKGFLGPPKILDEDFGFWRMVGSDRWDDKVITEGLGVLYEIRKDTFKPYPACRWLHATLDALNFIVTEQGFTARDVEWVKVRTVKGAVNLLDYNPETMIDGEFSLPYCCAMILMRQKPGPSWYSVENLSSKEVASCMAKVKAEVDPDIVESGWKDPKISAIVRVHLRDGKEKFPTKRRGGRLRGSYFP